MSLAKVVELLAEGDSIENAVQSAVNEAGETVRNIRHVYVNEIQAHVRDGKVSKYRVNCKITFQVDGSRD